MTVRIDRVTTRGGDKGQTSLGDGSRVSKASLHIEAIGALDEANTVIGLLRSSLSPAHAALTDRLAAIQNLLFDMGSDLCQPLSRTTTARVSEQALADLEQETATLQAMLPPLTSFVLPGGTPDAARAHLARTATRRAERTLVALSEHTPVSPALVPVLNRLSDYFFVLARHLNDNGAADILWQPGRSLRSRD